MEADPGEIVNLFDIPQVAGVQELLVAQLDRWRRALGVPVADLLLEPTESLSVAIAQRARLVKIMKTAAAIFEQSADSAARDVAEQLIAQLIDVMPELSDVKAWERVGKRRGGDELGRVADRVLAEEWILGDHQAHRERA